MVWTRDRASIEAYCVSPVWLIRTKAVNKMEDSISNVWQCCIASVEVINYEQAFQNVP